MRPVDLATWQRMSWHARRAYEARGGHPPVGHDLESRRRRYLEAAGLDPDTIDVVLGLRAPTYLGVGRPTSLSSTDQARQAQLELAQLYRAGVRHIEHRELPP